MKIIGHSLVPYKPLFYCHKESDIRSDRQNLFYYQEAMIAKAIKIGANFSLKTDDIVQVVMANACGAKYIITPKELAKEAAKVAQNYLFDSQICVIIESQAEIKELCELGVDVAIFAKGIKDGNF
ncbi:hypothetical protein [Campylobacter sp. RM16187]|uniref:hypothetical protein n=1 Tax=Campylobacter sp. RM16187 TaxID=1660063 RepID=UPI0021B52B72|nr:hypothetical protein [Campylobacter sp. RM16187]QKG28800.1 hypothetical protein CDOMF_0520 [Campylobacter sp. RM16187]